MRLKEGEPKGRHVVIVDDLVQSGGTLRECQVTKLLRWNLLLRMFGKVHLLSSHNRKCWPRTEHQKSALT